MVLGVALRGVWLKEQQSNAQAFKSEALLLGMYFDMCTSVIRCYSVSAVNSVLVHYLSRCTSASCLSFIIVGSVVPKSEDCLNTCRLSLDPHKLYHLKREEQNSGDM